MKFSIRHVIIRLALSVASACCAAGAGVQLSSPTADVFVSDSVVVGNNAFPTRYWDGQYLVAFNMFPAPTASIRLYDRSGKLARQANVSFEGTKEVSTVSVAASRQGDLYAAGHSTSMSGAVAFYIAEIARNGLVSRVIRTNPYVASYVCSTGDGGVWAFGAERSAGNTAPYDHPMLRHYSFTSGLIEQVFNKSQLAGSGRVDPLGWYPGETSLRCTPNSVSVYSGHTDQLITYDIANKKLTVAPVEHLPQPMNKGIQVTGFAVTDAGEVFASLLDWRQPSSGLFLLQMVDAGPARWVVVPETVRPRASPENSKFTVLLGTDGKNVVYQDLPNLDHVVFAEVMH